MGFTKVLKCVKLKEGQKIKAMGVYNGKKTW